MSSRSLPRPKKSTNVARNRKRNTRPASGGSSGWSTWWPLLVGIVITLVAVKTAEILPLTGAGGLLKLRLLYPYPLLLKQPQLGLTEQTTDKWSQILLYGQWVLYGLYASVAVYWTTRGRALLQLAAVHALGFGTLWWLAAQ